MVVALVAVAVLVLVMVVVVLVVVVVEVVQFDVKLAMDIISFQFVVPFNLCTRRIIISFIMQAHLGRLWHASIFMAHPSSSIHARYFRCVVTALGLHWC